MNILIVSSNPAQADEAARMLRFYAATPHRIDIWHNTERLGLSALYNRWLRDTPGDGPFVFTHQDVVCDTWQWDNRVLDGLKQFDVVGVAGTDAVNPYKFPLWKFGRVRHRTPKCELCGNILNADFKSASRERRCPYCKQIALANDYERTLTFGPTPAACHAVDGVMMACNARVARTVPWDEEFSFHFYDHSFCFRARAAGFKVGAIDLPLLHLSRGTWRKEWNQARDAFAKKYGVKSET